MFVAAAVVKQNQSFFGSTLSPAFVDGSLLRDMVGLRSKDLVTTTVA
jgi:hypothetical protein